MEKMLFVYFEILNLCEDDKYKKLSGIDHKLFSDLQDINKNYECITKNLEFTSESYEKLRLKEFVIKHLGSESDFIKFTGECKLKENYISRFKQMLENLEIKRLELVTNIRNIIENDADMFVAANKIINPNFSLNKKSSVKPETIDISSVKPVSMRERKSDNKIRLNRLFRKYLKSIERKSTFEFLIKLSYNDAVDIKKCFERCKSHLKLETRYADTKH